MIGWIKSKIQALFIPTVVTSNVFAASEVEQNVKNFFDSLLIIYRGMNNLLQFGNSGIQNVISYRRTWIMSKDTAVRTKEGNESAQEFIDQFDRTNSMKLMRQRMATNGEVEGKCLILLMLDQAGQRVVPRVLNFVDYQYAIEFNQFGEPISVSYSIGKQNITITPERFVYVPLSFTETYLDPRITPSCVSYVLENIINADKAYANWRLINDKSAKTTPIFETETWDDAIRVAKIIQGKNEDTTNQNERGKKWKIGEGIALKAKANLLQFNNSGIESLKDEITANAQKISGHTGIPIFLLGFPELIGGGRATAEEMAEAISNKTITERLIWTEKLTELYSKALSLSNIYFGTAFDPDCVTVNIPAVSLAEVNAMIATLESSVDKKYISKRTFLENIPGIDPDLEFERVAQESDDSMARMQTAMTGMDQTGQDGQMPMAQNNKMPLPGMPGKKLEGVK